MAETTAPLEVLLLRVVQQLERDVIPHVDGEVFATAAEAAEQLRRIVAVIITDDLPNYCYVAECQNLARTPSQLCLTHLVAACMSRRGVA